MDNTWFRNPLPANFNIYRTQVWVFGMIGETTRKVKIFIVDSRDNQRLGKLVAQHINPGCIVHTDGWRACGAIDWPGLGIRRHRHVHLNNRTEGILNIAT